MNHTTQLAKSLLPRCDAGTPSLEIVQRELPGFAADDEEGIARVLNGLRGWGAEDQDAENPFCPPKTPLVDAGYAAEHPGDS